MSDTNARLKELNAAITDGDPHMKSITADDWREVKQRGQEVIITVENAGNLFEALYQAQKDAIRNNQPQFIIIKITP